MSVMCPNRNRTKRLTRGGGKPGCQGRLEVVLTVPVVLSCKSLRTPHDPERTLPRRALKGVRVPGGALLEAFHSRSTSDIRCPSCGWSYRKLQSGLSPKVRGVVYVGRGSTA